MEQRTTKDTGEVVIVPAPAFRRINGDGLDWAQTLRRPWVGIHSWGRDGYELGSWPDVVVALADFPDPSGMLHGFCTYVEGQITPKWYRSEAERNLAVSNVALEYWANGQAEGPPELWGLKPHEFGDTSDLFEPAGSRPATA